MDQVKEKILKACELRMIKFGFRKVGMDEIARDLAISKNTIYKHFQSKEDIAKAIFENLRARINEKILYIEKNEKDPLTVISQNIMFVQKELAPWFEHFLGDIKTELPELWQKFINYRTEKILEVEELIRSGIKKKKFRDVNSMIATRTFLGAIDSVINPDFLQNENISFQNAMEQVVDIWSKGMIKNNN